MLIVKGKNEKSIYIRDNVLNENSLVIETEKGSLVNVSDIDFNYAQINKLNWIVELEDLLSDYEEINAKYSNLILYLNLKEEEIEVVKKMSENIKIDVILSIQTNGVLEVTGIL
ncbi:hypothetical protein [Lysinibacillus sp. BPa_S21]|uniref:hypothetical protein n=1 Tax=Lysinibacillus sp. BPa_S21 TaxID=2932478 RepID=UPI002010C818|nr:hypothetical protein [Lysinibacillus sp. BPa_S21]MCL1696303.1 hypothetical protein [Lysinibacillus sp. BPa_S21]